MRVHHFRFKICVVAKINQFIKRCKFYITEGAVIVDLSRQHYNRPTRTWNDAVRQCYKQNGYQISTDVESVVQNNSELSYFEKAWIGAFRRHHGFTISTKAGVLIIFTGICLWYWHSFTIFYKSVCFDHIHK